MNSICVNNNSNKLVGSFQQYVMAISSSNSQYGHSIDNASAAIQYQNFQSLQMISSNPMNIQSRPITKLPSQPLAYNNCYSYFPSNEPKFHYSPIPSSNNQSPVSSSFSVSPSSSIDGPLGVISKKPMMNFETKKKQLPVRSAAIDINELLKNKNQGPKNQYCTFCKNNNESEDVYRSHILKDAHGKIVCPILKLHKCPTCGASGEQAHTITYCKKYQNQRKLQVLQKSLNNICKN